MEDITDKLKEVKVEWIDINKIKLNEKNYREHSDDQIAHIVESMRINGIYRNLVIAKDGTLLAGHGVYKAAKKIGFKIIPVIRLDYEPDSIQAKKVLVGDNEIARLANVNDRLLADILKEIKELDPVGLLGTGFDSLMLANLILVTRPEVNSINQAAEWVGMPEFEPGVKPEQLIINFESINDKIEFGRKLGYVITEKIKSVWYPIKERDDSSSLKIEG